MFPARRTDPAQEQALTAALDRLTGGAADRADTPDGWITAVRRLPPLEARYARLVTISIRASATCCASAASISSTPIRPWRSTMRLPAVTSW